MYTKPYKIHAILKTRHGMGDPNLQHKHLELDVTRPIYSPHQEREVEPIWVSHQAKIHPTIKQEKANGWELDHVIGVHPSQNEVGQKKAQEFIARAKHNNDLIAQRLNEEEDLPSLKIKLQHAKQSYSRAKHAKLNVVKHEKKIQEIQSKIDSLNESQTNTLQIVKNALELLCESNSHKFRITYYIKGQPGKEDSGPHRFDVEANDENHAKEIFRSKYPLSHLYSKDTIKVEKVK